MKVIVHLVSGEILEGEYSKFGCKGSALPIDLRDFGFWLKNWHFDRDEVLIIGGMFIPWSSVKYIVEAE